MGFFLHMGVPVLATAAVVFAAGFEQAYKKKPIDKDTLRLEPGFAECFPNDPKRCSRKGLFAACCAQEIACLDFHRVTVMGKLDVNVKVRVREDFVSDDDQDVKLTKGMTGRV